MRVCHLRAEYVVHACDLNMEAASEHKGHNSSYVTIRNNLFYDGQHGRRFHRRLRQRRWAAATTWSLSTTRSTTTTRKIRGREFQIQYHSATNNIFENNIVYAGTQNVWIYSYVSAIDGDGELEPLLFDKGYVQGTSIDWGGQVTTTRLRRVSVRQRGGCEFAQRRIRCSTT